MNAANYARAKEGIYHESLVVLPLKAVNVSRPCVHGPAEGPFSAQLVPSHLHKDPCALPYILHGGDHVDPLVQTPPSLFLGELVLSHCQ